VTAQILVFGSLLLVCLGLLLGATWNTQALQPKLRHQAEERRRLNAEWVAIRRTQRSLRECPHCASALSEPNGYYPPILLEPPDND
jgi:hypothetical protein